MNIFNKIPIVKPKSNVFDLSHSKVLSFNLGELIPILVMDVIPGDKINCSTQNLLRFSPLVSPVMHRFDVFTHSFYCPNRLLWTTSDDDDDSHFGWEAFITGGEDGTLDPTFPMVEVSSTSWVLPGSKADYMGVPSITYSSEKMYLNALPFRMYRLIWNEYYRNQNIQDPILIDKSETASYAQHLYSAGDSLTGYGPMKVNYERDYLTSALPWVQRGADVLMPASGDVDFVPEYLTQSNLVRTAGGNPADGDIKSDTGKLEGFGSDPARLENLAASKVYDVENFSITIADLRLAASLQRWLESNARGGSRYKETILSLFGVMTSDARLDRPEYLSGGKAPMIISEVLATASDTAATPDTEVGDMAGHGISAGQTNQFTKYIEEHGFIMTLMFVRPKAVYYQGLPKMFQKNDRYDYFFRHFQNIGEQEILNSEVFFDGGGTLDPNGTFGYAPRYAEYKHINDSVHGEFRTSLAYWHLARDLDNTATLNSDFVECTPDDRIFAVTTYNTIYAQIHHNIKAIRPMEYFGIPKL